MALLQAQGDLPASSVAFPVLVDLGPIFQQVELQAPRVPPGVETWTPLPQLPGTGVFRFNLYRDPLLLRMARNRLLVRTTAHYWLEFGLKAGGLVKSVGSCGLGKEGFRKVYLGASADVTVQPDWNLRVKVTPLSPEALSPCTVTLLQVDITPEVLKGMSDQIAKATAEAEKLLATSALLRQKAEALWTEVQKPIEMAPGIWLSLQPEGLRLGAWKGEGRNLTIPLEVQARPTVVLGAVPVHAGRPLPPLDIAQGPLPDVFRVQVQADLPFDQASLQMQKALQGKVFQTDKGTFVVKDVAVKAAKGRPVIELDLGGRIEGRISLTGDPVFDEATGALRLKNLDFTLESQSWINRFGAWLFRSSLRKTLEEKGNLILGQSFQEVQGLIQKGMNRPLAPGLELGGTVEKLRIGVPEVLGDRFRVQASLEGRALVRVTRGMP